MKYLSYEEDIFKIQMDARYARFIEEVIKKASYYIPQSEEEIMDIVETAYEYVYHSTLNIFRKALRDRIELTDIYPAAAERNNQTSSAKPYIWTNAVGNIRKISRGYNI